MGTVFSLISFAGSRFMFSWGEGEVVKMDLYILHFCISNFCGKTFCGDSFFLDKFHGESIYVFAGRG